MHLYGHTSSGNVYKVAWLLEQLGIAFEHTPSNFWGDTRTPEFRALNPNGKVPVLDTPDGPIWESNAILQYLANGTSWWPEDRLQQARVLQWMFFEQYSHEPFIATSRAIMHFQEPSPERDAKLAAKREGGLHALAVMEAHLASHDFFGESPSIADVSLFAYTHVAEEGGFSLQEYPHIQAWIQRMQAMGGPEMQSFATLTRT